MRISGVFDSGSRRELSGPLWIEPLRRIQAVTDGLRLDFTLLPRQTRKHDATQVSPSSCRNTSWFRLSRHTQIERAFVLSRRDQRG